MTPYRWDRRGPGSAPDARQLDGDCAAYFEHCAREGREPTRPGLMLWLDITPAQWERWWAAASGEKGERGAVLRRAQAVISDSLLQRRDPMAVQLVKLEQAAQQKKQEQTPEVKIRVVFGEGG